MATAYLYTADLFENGVLLKHGEGSDEASIASVINLASEAVNRYIADGYEIMNGDACGYDAVMYNETLGKAAIIRLCVAYITPFTDVNGADVALGDILYDAQGREYEMVDLPDSLAVRKMHGPFDSVNISTQDDMDALELTVDPDQRTIAWFNNRDNKWEYPSN